MSFLALLTLLTLYSDLVSSANTILPPPPPPPPTNYKPLSSLPPLPNITKPMSAYFWNKEEYPEPLKNPKFCNQTKPSLLCDPDAILTREQAIKLVHLMGQTSNVTKCYCKECPPGGTGVSVAIALAQNIFKNYNSPVDSNEEFANHLRHRWQYGTCDNTILILFVATTDQLTVSLGVIAEKVFEVKFFDSLIKAHKNEFNRGQIYEGLVSIIGGIRHHMLSSKAPANLDHDGTASRAMVTTTVDPQAGTKTAVAVVGIVVGFMLVIFVLTGTIIFAKRRFEAQGDEVVVDQEPEGYWSNGEKKEEEEDDDDDDPEEPRSGDDDDDEDRANPPPLPTTPPPSTPSLSLNTTRKLSTPNGTVEYEPLSLEDDDTPRQVPQSQETQRQSSIPEPRSSIGEIGHLHGQEELLDQSSRISTPEAERSRL